MPIEIIQPSIDDWQKVKELRLDALRQDQQAFGISYEEDFNEPDTYWKEKLKKSTGNDAKEILVIAKENDKYVGMLTSENASGDTWFIHAVYVKPDERRKGVAKKLLEQMLTLLHNQNDIQNIELKVNVEQEAAVNLYKSYGFTINSTAQQELGDGKIHEVYEMKKQI